jgi:hypothetical protein
MTQDIVYGYVRRASRKLLIVLGILLAIAIFIGVTNTTPLGRTPTEISNMLLIYYGVLALLSLGMLYAVVMLVKPDLHPLFRRLSGYGSPAEIVRRIDEEAKQYVETIKLSRAGYHATFTQNWIIWSRGVLACQLRAVNVADLSWVYPHTVVTNGVADYRLAIHTNDGKKTNMNFYRNGQKVHEIIARIKHHAPEVRTGYP